MRSPSHAPHQVNVRIITNRPNGMAVPLGLAAASSGATAVRVDVGATTRVTASL